jgi:hypothetical protein
MDIYIGVFLISFTSLALEVTLTRILSVTTWYYLAFFAISTALLGMTVGAVIVYLKPDFFTKERLNSSLARACSGYAAIMPLSLVLLCLIPIQTSLSVIWLCAFIVVTLACALPFCFSGVVVSAVLTKSLLPIGKLYASDLIGAALGCLFVLGGLTVMDAPSLVLLCGAIGVLASLCFAWRNLSRSKRVRNFVIFLLFVLIASANAATNLGIRPVAAKGRIDDAASIYLDKWNSFSRVVVHQLSLRPPQYWGPSPLAPQDPIYQYYMNIDGEAGTTLQRFASLGDIDHLRYDVTNAAYYLRPTGTACVIGVGGGRDIQSAILFGHEKVVGIDVNPVFISLLQNEMKDFAGIAGHPGVTLVADEARSYLSRTPTQYSIIQMSLIDTFASTGSGAFTLSENALYTTEAWKIFLGRLTDDGVFTVSRWYGTGNLGETGRLVSLAVATLLQTGVNHPAEHIAMLTSGNIATLIVSKQPFSEQDIATLHKVSSSLIFNAAIMPGTLPENRILRNMVTSESMSALNAAIANEPLNYQPTTDENPYFFNMLRLDRIPQIYPAVPGVIYGNLLASVTLIGLIVSLFLLTILMVFLPLIIQSRQKHSSQNRSPILWPAVFYFSLIGAGFMFVEIGLTQKLSVFLSHPIYALGILLFTIIASTGVGSLLSERIPLTRSLWKFLLPVILALAILLVRSILSALMSSMVSAPMANKIAVSILTIFPLGILMGAFFPMGMRLVQATNTSEMPWYWAVNGTWGVLCSALAVFVSIYSGISYNFYLAAFCYAGLFICIYFMDKIGSTQARKNLG